MNAPASFDPLPDLRGDFPGLRTPDGAPWHYLDTAATAQKPRAVIEAMARALGEDYATVHRGVYARSAEMTRAYEAARRTIATFLGGMEDEIVFTRGATEAINLVANSWGRANLKSGDRILLSQLEHHSNIVPWQMLTEATGAAIDVCPLTDDHRIDLDAAEAMLTERHKLVAFGHVSNVLGSVLDAPRAAALAHRVGAKLLLDGCQSAPHMPVDVAALGCDFYVFRSAVGEGRNSRRHAPVGGRRRDDRPRDLRQDHLCPAAAAVRSRNARDHRSDRLCRRCRLCERCGLEQAPRA